jgi:hypothetical protein
LRLSKQPKCLAGRTDCITVRHLNLARIKRGNVCNGVVVVATPPWSDDRLENAKKRLLNWVQRLMLSQNKAWSYVGRFITSFALIENNFNQLFHHLIGVGQPNSYHALLLTYSFDLRKKLELTQIILKRRDVDASKMFKRLHQLHDLRNVITHFPFEEDANGLSCDYINKYGGTIFSKKPATSEDNYWITYAEFDFYDAVATELYNKLQELWETAFDRSFAWVYALREPNGARD